MDLKPISSLERSTYFGGQLGQPKTIKVISPVTDQLSSSMELDRDHRQMVVSISRNPVHTMSDSVHNKALFWATLKTGNILTYSTVYSILRTYTSPSTPYNRIKKAFLRYAPFITVIPFQGRLVLSFFFGGATRHLCGGGVW